MSIFQRSSSGSPSTIQLRHLTADPAGAGDAVGGESGGDPEAADLGFAEDELVVGGERLGAVDDPADPRVGHRRDAGDRAFHDRLEARQVGRQQLAVEVGRDAVERPGRRIALVAAHAQATDLLAKVDEMVRIAELGQARMDALDGLGEEVLVRHRDQRHGHADHAARSPGRTCRRRRRRCRRRSPVRSPRCSTVTPVTRPRSVPMPTTRWCGRIEAPRCRAPAASACASPDGSSQPSVGSQTPPRTPSVDMSGKRSCGLPRRDQVHRQAERLGPAGLAGQLLEPLRRRRQPDRPDLVPRRVDPGLVQEPPVEVGPVHHHPGQGHRAAELADETRRMERRAAGELGPVDEDDVGPAALGEVVGDRRPADAAADDHRPRVLHALPLLPCPAARRGQPSGWAAGAGGRCRRWHREVVGRRSPSARRGRAHRIGCAR